MGRDYKKGSEKMKKMAVFIYSMAGGGAEKVVSNLLPAFCENYEVHLVLMNERIYYDLPKGLKVHFIEHSKPFENGLIKLLKLPFLALKYKKLCTKLGIEIHFVCMERPCFISVLSRLFGMGGTLILNEGATPSVIYAKKCFKSSVGKFLIRQLYPKADFVFPNSQGNLEDLKENFGVLPEKMAVQYNATDLEQIAELSKEPISQERPFFLTIGRLDSGKNHELLIRAYAKLKNNDKDLLILGEGLLKEHLQGVINELGLGKKVKLLGFEKNPYKYLSKCYAFVFVSLFEGFSNALIEALACGKMVISSDHKSGARELLGENEWGVLVGVNDLNSTKDAMQKALDDENYVKFYEKKAKIRALFFNKNRISKWLIEKIGVIDDRKN